MNIHRKLAWFFLAVMAALFVAKYAFGMSSVGFWTLLPLPFFFWANWFAGREEREAGNG